MKLLVLQLIAFIGLADAAFADTSHDFSITTNQAVEIKQKLDAFENGKFRLQDLNENAGTEGLRELIGYYLLHSNNISTKAKLPVARSFAAFGMLPQALPLAKEYLNVYSNDWRGWILLGHCYYFLNFTNEAIQTYTKAIELGDNDSYEILAGIAINSDRMDIIKSLIPQLISLKNAPQTPYDKKVSLMNILMVCSAKTEQKEVFIKALEGMDMKVILKDADAKENIPSGCHIFQGKDIDKIRQEMKSALQPGLTNGADTNPSS